MTYRPTEFQVNNSGGIECDISAMSTDKELLELAAKAAGKYGLRYVNNEPIQGGYRTGLWCDLEEQCWNPLTDNGQALELAVKLELEIWIGNGGVYVGGMTMDVDEDYGADAYAATRRAIVRAAAEIGKGMP